MTLPTREEIAEIAWEADGRRWTSPSQFLPLADQLLARLRPGWTEMEKELSELKALLRNREKQDKPYSGGRDRFGNPVNYCD